MSHTIAVIDCGSRHTSKIIDNIMELGVNIETMPMDVTADEVNRYKMMDSLRGIVISGSPIPVQDPQAPRPDPKILDLGIPIFGICYGFEYIAHTLGGKVQTGKEGEFGTRQLYVNDEGELLKGVGPGRNVIMRHSDFVYELPEDFRILASTKLCPIAAYECPERRLYGTQFHPEIMETEKGLQILQNFIDIAKRENGFNVNSYLHQLVKYNR